MNAKLVMFVLRAIVGASAGTVVGNAIRATTPATISMIDKVFVGIGAFALGGIAGDKSADYMLGGLEKRLGITKESSQ